MTFGSLLSAWRSSLRGRVSVSGSSTSRETRLVLRVHFMGFAAEVTVDEAMVEPLA